MWPSDAEVNVHGALSIALPLQPLLGEGLFDSVVPVGGECVPAADSTSFSTTAFDEVSLEGMLATDPDVVRNSFKVSKEGGYLRPLEAMIDSLYFADVYDVEDNNLNVIVTGALCDCMAAGIAPVLCEFVSEYVVSRYEDHLMRVQGVFLAQEIFLDCLTRADARKALVANASYAVTRLFGTNCDGDGQTADSEAPTASDVKIIGMVNVDGRRLRSVEEYCTEAAGFVLAQACGMVDAGLHEPSDQFSLSCGIAFVRYPLDTIRRLIALRRSYDCIEWWCDIDDLWETGGWSDFGAIGADQGQFFRREVHRRANEEDASKYSSIVEALKDAACELGCDSAVQDGQRPEEQIATALADSLLSDGIELVLSERDSDGTCLGEMLADQELRKLPSGMHGMVEYLADASSGNASSGRGKGLELCDQLQRFANALLWALRCVDERLNDQVADAARLYFRVPRRGVDSVRERAWSAILSHGTLRSLHPIAVRCVLYACEDEFDSLSASLRQASMPLASDDGSKDALLSLESQIEEARRTVAAIKSAHDSDGSWDFMSTNMSDRAAASQLAQAIELLENARLRLDDMVRSYIHARFVAEALRWTRCLEGTYEELFFCVRSLQKEIANEASKSTKRLVRATDRGSVVRDACAESVVIDDMMAHCEDAGSNGMVPSYSWDLLFVRLLEYAKHMSGYPGDIELNRTREQGMMSCVRKVVVDRWATLLEKPDSPYAKILNMNVFEAMGYEQAALAKRGLPKRDVIAEAWTSAGPFGARGKQLVDTYDTLACKGTPALRGVSSHGFDNTIAFDGDDPNAVMVCRQIVARKNGSSADGVKE